MSKWIEEYHYYNDQIGNASPITISLDDTRVTVYKDKKIEYRKHINGMTPIHRIDGPALIYTDGANIWYIDGWDIDSEIHIWANEMSIDLDNLTDDDKVIIGMVWTLPYVWDMINKKLEVLVS